MVMITDGPGWPKYTAARIKRLEKLLKSLERKYSNGKNGGLRGAVRDGVITEAQRSELVTYIDWDNA